ncbi:MAG: DNA-directed DNA polymerase I [Promethearchaeota archaeon]
MNENSIESSISIDDVISTNDNFFKVESSDKPLKIPKITQAKQFEHCLLLNVEYDRKTNKALMRFYDVKNHEIIFLWDTTGHQPYCLSRRPKSELMKFSPLLNVDGFDRIETVKKMDLLKGEVLEFSKIFGRTPLTIAGGSSNIKKVLPDVLEANIRYHLNYINDLLLIPGTYYSYKNGKLEQDDITLDPSIRMEIDELMRDSKADYKELFETYLKLFKLDVPDLLRVAVDIEIYQENEHNFPDPNAVKNPIIAASVVGTDGRNDVFLLKDHGFTKIGKITNEVPENLKIYVFQAEKDLIKELFQVIWTYPVVITFNGDEFDFRYLYNRARKLGIPENDIPIRMERGIGISKNSAFLKYGMHVDLYQFFRNRSIQGYGFSGAYREFSLDTIAQALLGQEKFKHEKSISELSLFDLVYYNWKDSKLTLDLTTFKSNLTMTLIILLMRITRMPMNEIVRTWVSAWIKQLLIWEHRKRNYVVPNREEIQAATGGAGQELKGALVIDPKPGIYFDVVVMDFSSLYPSIIKEYNLSYETINCRCKNCNKVPLANTKYHVCGNRIGIMALITGVIRDLRVLYFKPKSKDKKIDAHLRTFYSTLQSALKVLINASYGVYGSENFSLYCYPVAASTTAIGRYSITKTAAKAEEIGVTVLYGDSDSVFLKSPTGDQIDKLKRWSEETLRLDLDVDKKYTFLALSGRKKNYLGVFSGGGLDIKGLTGKKSNTPRFVREAFFQFTEIIKGIKSKDDFQAKKEEILSLTRQYWMKLKKGNLPIESYEIKVQLQSKTIRLINSDDPLKIRLQHVVAARELRKLTGKRFEAGESFSYVKTKYGAKALDIAKVEDVDRKKYMAQFQSTFEQVLDALGISFEEIIGIRTLDSFF